MGRIEELEEQVKALEGRVELQASQLADAIPRLDGALKELEAERKGYEAIITGLKDKLASGNISKEAVIAYLNKNLK